MSEWGTKERSSLLYRSNSSYNNRMPADQVDGARNGKNVFGVIFLNFSFYYI